MEHQKKLILSYLAPSFISEDFIFNRMILSNYRFRYYWFFTWILVYVHGVFCFLYSLPFFHRCAWLIESKVPTWLWSLNLLWCFYMLFLFFLKEYIYFFFFGKKNISIFTAQHLTSHNHYYPWSNFLSY